MATYIICFYYMTVCNYERQRKIILPRGGNGGQVLYLHPEGWAAEHNSGRCTVEKQEGERPDDEEHRRGEQFFFK